ncbi:hypothetical protein T484DRAFT_3641368 [Baffinella frigidus]|nr:hypothetical protein T484DRAFT_3641368 [Cryptophyta sp. CCMP2293]
MFSKPATAHTPCDERGGGFCHMSPCWVFCFDESVGCVLPRGASAEQDAPQGRSPPCPRVHGARLPPLDPRLPHSVHRQPPRLRVCAASPPAAPRAYRGCAVLGQDGYGEAPRRAARRGSCGASAHDPRLAADCCEGAGPQRGAPLHPTLYNLHPTPYTLHPEPYTLHLTPCTRHPTPYTLHPTPCALHPTPYTLHPTPYTLHPAPCTLHPAPYTLHPQPFTLHPTPCTLHPTPSTLSPTRSWWKSWLKRRRKCTKLRKHSSPASSPPPSPWYPPPLQP